MVHEKQVFYAFPAFHQTGIKPREEDVNSAAHRLTSLVKLDLGWACTRPDLTPVDLGFGPIWLGLLLAQSVFLKIYFQKNKKNM